MCQTTSPTPVHSFFPLISPPPRPASRRAGLFMNGCGLPSFLPSFILGGLNESLATHHRPLLSMSLLGEERVVLLLPRKWLSHTWQKEGKGGKHSWEGGGEWAPLVKNNLLTAERRLLSVWFINFCKRTLYTVMWNSSERTYLQNFLYKVKNCLARHIWSVHNNHTVCALCSECWQWYDIITFNIVPILVSILQVYIPPSGPVPGTAGLEEAEGVHESGAGGAQHEVVLIDVEAARDRQVQ